MVSARAKLLEEANYFESTGFGKIPVPNGVPAEYRDLYRAVVMRQLNTVLATAPSQGRDYRDYFQKKINSAEKLAYIRLFDAKGKFVLPKLKSPKWMTPEQQKAFREKVLDELVKLTIQRIAGGGVTSERIRRTSREMISAMERNAKSSQPRAKPRPKAPAKRKPVARRARR